MIINTKCFGEINIGEDKIITFERGILGFEDFKTYTILYNEESTQKGENRISWLQSVEEPALALPMITPALVKEEYNPVVSEEDLKAADNVTDSNLAMFLVITVPSDITKMTANLKAPIIINADTRKGVQAVAQNPDYPVKLNIYNVLSKKEETKC